VDYDAFTRELTERLAHDRRVTGLVAVGSMANRDYAPDEWSDHDFFVITPADGQEALRRDLSWLPHAEQIELSVRETAHGLKVLYRDGHLAEFAVFDLEEIGLASVNRYRVLLDRGGVEERLAEVAARPREEPSDEYLFGMFVAGVQVAAGRARRGERLSSASFLLAAARSLCALLARALPSAEHEVLDAFDPLRRFERAYPKLGAELRVSLDDPVSLLELAERELRGLRPSLPWAALGAVRDRVG
jgi:hypothetical protein